MSRSPYPARSRLGESFYARPVEEVARDLLGCILVHRSADALVALRLVEVEAYRGEGLDPASHAHRGPTFRNRHMFETPGRLYVYLSYGVHHCLNVVCEPAGHGAAVLLRGAEVVEGEAVLAARRGRSGIGIANGPGKIGQALAAGPDWDGRTLLRGELGIWPGFPPSEIRSTSRVGISKGIEAQLRFFDASSPCVSRARPAL